MSEPFSLCNQFLLAMPTLFDPNFSKGVTYICQHDEEGAMGIMINRPLEIKLGEIFKQMDLECSDAEIINKPVFLGGPVQSESGFVIHKPSGEWDAVLKVTDDIAVASSPDILSAIADGHGPKECLIALGYAGWGADQLEKELVTNTWLNVPANDKLLFDPPYDKRWESAAMLAGIDINTISSNIGHA